MRTARAIERRGSSVTFGKGMKKRTILFSLAIAATGTVFFLAWQVLHASLVPPAVQAAAAEGARIPPHQILTVDLIGLPGVWLAWSLSAMLGCWYLERSGRWSRRAATLLFALYLVPLFSTSAMLISAGNR